MARDVRDALRPAPDPYQVPWPNSGTVSDQAFSAAESIRGFRGPAIMLHGVMPRSGTVYVGELLRLHPDLYAFPNEMWEIPFLAMGGRIEDLQHSFFKGYKHNATRMGHADFLPLFGSAFLAYLHEFMPADRRLLIKEAGVSHLGLFPKTFPQEHLLLLLRDGRDLVHSTMRTWPDNDFDEICQRWADSTRAVLAYYELYKERTPGCWLASYERVQNDPEDFLRQVCARFDLDPARYPFDRIPEVRVIGSSTTSEKGGVDWSKHEAAPKDFRPVGHWQSWPAAWKRTFKDLAGDALIACGYAENHDW